MRAQAAAHPATNEYGHPNITPLPNKNEYGDTWDDIIASLQMMTNVNKITKQASGNHRSDVGHESLVSSDHVGHQVVREKLVPEPVFNKSLFNVTLLIFLPFSFLYSADIINFPLYSILNFRFTSNTDLYLNRMWQKG